MARAISHAGWVIRARPACEIAGSGRTAIEFSLNGWVYVLSGAEILTWLMFHHRAPWRVPSQPSGSNVNGQERLATYQIIHQTWSSHRLLEKYGLVKVEVAPRPAPQRDLRRLHPRTHYPTSSGRSRPASRRRPCPRSRPTCKRRSTAADLLSALLDVEPPPRAGGPTRTPRTPAPSTTRSRSLPTGCPDPCRFRCRPGRCSASSAASACRTAHRPCVPRPGGRRSGSSSCPPVPTAVT